MSPRLQAHLFKNGEFQEPVELPCLMKGKELFLRESEEF